MSYDYGKQKESLFTPDGVDTLLKIRDSVRVKLSESGAVMSGYVLDQGDAWTMLAVLDYLVERGEIREITGEGVAGQRRVFVRTY